MVVRKQQEGTRDMQQIQTLNNISNVVRDILTPDAYKIDDQISQPVGILVRSAKCHEMELNPELRAIARAGAGTNNLPVERCTKQGICVFNTPGANANAVMELVFGAMLASSRNLVEAIEWVRTIADEGADIPALVESGKKRFLGREIAGKTLGVIGLGAIGVMVANNGYAQGMQVLGYDPFISVQHAWGLSRAVERAVSLDEMLACCDFLTIHVPLSDKTRGFINGELLKKVKRGVTLLNFARGELVDNGAVLAALTSGDVGRYITDFPSEELINQQGVTCIPHLGASTPESEENCAIMAARELKDFLENGNIENSANMPNCSMSRSGAMRICIIHENAPNMIGKFTATLAARDANITNLTNRSRGDIAYTMIDIDEAIAKNIGDELENDPAVIRATVL